MRGKFITLEGIDGAGKSTHLEWLAGFLKSRGLPVRVTREPGGTELGEKLRQILLDRNQHLHPETEALLMFGARREHLDKVIVPSLEAGTWVVCDRFTDATYAYQSGGSGIPWDRIEVLRLTTETHAAHLRRAHQHSRRWRCAVSAGVRADRASQR